MKYYLAGIKGTGMSALALILDDLGFEVVGYDDAEEHRFTEDKLVERGIKIYTKENDAMDKDTIVVYLIRYVFQVVMVKQLQHLC